jgi:predicted  nucleic acid-binding Zn-ribbon protein
MDDIPEKILEEEKAKLQKQIEEANEQLDKLEALINEIKQKQALRKEQTRQLTKGPSSSY